MPDLADAAWLRRRTEAGASVKEVAAEVGQTPRTVRDVLHRDGIPVPSQLRREAIDVAAILDDYRRGVPLNRIAAAHGVSPRRVTALAAEHGAKRDVAMQPKRRDSKFPELDDLDWLRMQLAETGINHIARQLGTSSTNVRAALRRHGIPRPTPRLTHVETIEATTDPTLRYKAASRLVADLDATLDAAKALQADAHRELDRRHSP